VCRNGGFRTSSRKNRIAFSLDIFQSWLQPARGLLGRYFRRAFASALTVVPIRFHRWQHFSWWRFGGQDCGSQNEQKLHEVHEPQLPLDSQTKISNIRYCHLCRWQRARWCRDGLGIDIYMYLCIYDILYMYDMHVHVYIHIYIHTYIYIYIYK